MVCVNNHDLFCYVCGEYCVSKQRKKITATFKEIYQRYFGIELRCGENIKYAPSIVCEKCYKALFDWHNGKIDFIEYAFPMLWSPMENHIAAECYFCTVEIFGHNRKTKSIISYPNLDTALRPIYRRPGMPLPVRNNTQQQQNPVVVLESDSPPIYDDTSSATLADVPLTSHASVPSTSHASDPTFVPTEPILCEHIVFTKEQ